MPSSHQLRKITSVLLVLFAAGAVLPAHAGTKYVYRFPFKRSAPVAEGLTLSNPTFPLTLMYEASVAVAVLTNNTNEAVTLTQPDASTVTNPFDTTFRFSAPETTCGTILAARMSCNIGAEFTPYAVGTSQAAMTVDTSLGARQVFLSATSIGGFTSFDNDTVDFGATPVGVPVNRTVTLTNTGSGSLPFTEIKVQNRTDYGPAPEFTQTNNCGSSLAVGASCTFTLTFTPSAPGVYDQYGAEVLVDHRGVGNARIYLGGTGL